MNDWATVIIPTFYDENKEMDKEKLKVIVENSGVDIVTLKNAMIGRGLGFLLKTPVYSKIEKIVNALKMEGVPCLPAKFSEVKKEVGVYNAKHISWEGNGLRIDTVNNGSFYVKDKLIVVSDFISQEVVTIKKAVIPANKICLITRGNVFVVDFSTVRILTLDGQKGISQKANLIQLLEKIKEKDNLILDSSFYYQSGFFLKDVVMLSMFVSYAFKNGLYQEQLPESLFKVIRQKQKPVFKHRIISGSLKVPFYMYKLSLRDSIVYPPSALVIVLILFVYSGARLDIPLFYWLATLLGFLVSTYKLFNVWKIKNLIEDTPTSKLRSVAAGFVEVFGKLVSPAPIVSPISGSSCVFFRYTKEKLVHTSNRRSRWQVVEIGEGFADNCILRDETGEIGVNVKNASFLLTNKYTTNTTFYEMQYGLFANEKVRYTEEYILDGQSIYVLGTARPVSKGVSYGKFLSELKKDKEKMKKFDLNGDGIIDADEWNKAQEKLRDEYLEYKQFKGQASELLIDRDKRNGIFVISNEKENKILKRLKIALPLYFIGSIVFLVLTLWLTVKIF